MRAQRAKAPRPLRHLVVHRGSDQELLLAAVLEQAKAGGFEARGVGRRTLPAGVALALDQDLLEQRGSTARMRR